ncbi:DUF2061 domain-containing protein [Sedimentitalea sp. HM32M-2]|uniref:DUF2061 domain-containing protein n=1 Tax=Sedimentitalea sp. HM32M-2 TaxID=3351566 RepID=UPI00362D7689
MAHKNRQVSETRRRSLVKAVIWNGIGFVIMSLVGVAVTGSPTAGGGMALINTAIGLTGYVLYERIWAGIRWGRHV